jgi:hypothetical protein
VQLTKSVKVAFIGMALTVAGSAGAQEIHFAGTTSGCFYQGTVCVPAATPVTIGGLTYGSGPGNQFDNYTDEDGYLAIGDAYENFGIFSLNNTNFDYNGWKFVLKVMFSAPPGVNSVTPASLIGQVKNGTGGVTIDFDNAIQSFTSDDAVTVTPEPATVALMMTGIAGLVPMVRGRRKPRNEE